MLRPWGEAIGRMFAASMRPEHGCSGNEGEEKTKSSGTGTGFNEAASTDAPEMTGKCDFGRAGSSRLQ